ncbi:efflux RND transporter periplasmic adaptor subunit [Photobacterium alginatilyticum]|uniref:efflux RND transporter periplasmic adaptor subunit n=1 Tax=Photobacterium alginatilyticum TaxID=1775171 RepID=UPI00406837ED
MKTQQGLRNLVLATVAASVLMACQPQREEQAGMNQPPAPQITVAQVISERVTEWDEFTGRLQAPQTVELRPRVSGYVEQVVFEEGALVKAGDVLFMIDAKPLEAQVNRLKADLIDAESQALLAQRQLTRGKKLIKKNAISQEELDNRAASFQQANARVQSRKAALDQAKLDLEYTKVKAPISGRVSSALITKGNYVTAGQSLLTTLVSTDTIYAYFDADEQTYLKYKRLAREGSRLDSHDNKSPVMMGLADDKGFPYTGHIDFMDNQINEQTGTIRGRAVFENTDGRFTPGLFARIKVAGSASYQGVLIDDKAVGTDLNTKFVLVLDQDNKVQYRPVKLGKKHNGLRLVSDGLQPGDTIVLKGLQRVRPGAAVNPTPAAMASDEALAQIKRQQQRVDELQAEVTIASSDPLAGKRG